jgi:hypothetical protein
MGVVMPDLLFLARRLRTLSAGAEWEVFSKEAAPASVLRDPLLPAAFANFFAINQALTSITGNVDCDINAFDFSVPSAFNRAFLEHLHHVRGPRLRAKRAERASADRKAVIVNLI